MKKKIMKYTLSVILITVAIFANAQEKKIIKVQKELGIPAMQIAYSKGDDVSYYALGVKSLDSQEKIDTASIFQAASLSKVVFGYICMKLQERGVFDLDTPLSNYFEYDRLSEIPVARAITARHVLTHRTGLPNWEVRVGTKEWYDSKLSTEFAPGERFRYSGEGFYYLQLTLEKLTGKTLDQLASEEVFIPFGMVNSSYSWKERYENNPTIGHKVDKTVLKVVRTRNANSAYTLFTTAADYHKFVKRALLKGEGLKPETYQLMVSKLGDCITLGNPKNKDEYIFTGMSVRLQESHRGYAYWHTGSNAGYRCYFITYPDTQEILTVFTNSENGFKSMADIIPLFLGKKGPHHLVDWILN